MIASACPPVNLLHVSLEGTKPLVWRRVKVRSDITLAALHYVLQTVMGWDNDHPHDFSVGRTFYGVIAPADIGVEVLDEYDYCLRDIAPKKGSKFVYTYDFGDCWRHRIKVEAVIAIDPDYEHPVCVGGENACPPENVGGVWAYENLLHSLSDPNRQAHQEHHDWFGGMKFDPTAFDLKKVNRGLAKFNG